MYCDDNYDLNEIKQLAEALFCLCADHGVATISRIDEIIGLFCKRALSKRLYSAKETCNLIDPSRCSHPMPHCIGKCMYICI